MQVSVLRLACAQLELLGAGRLRAACRAHVLRRAPRQRHGRIRLAGYLAKLARMALKSCLEPKMQFNILEAKNQLSKLVEAAQRGEDVVIANRGKPVVRLVKVEPTTRRRSGACAG